MTRASANCGPHLSTHVYVQSLGRGRNIFEELMDNFFPNLIKTLNPQIQKAQRTQEQKT